ncbi:SDR family NAD(P)-dependent oxidoreductase [Mycobacterium colombiense]|uniref:SDR family NAD(P)-dependent oxidoreductase n=1 Tax=Mycobacterium colombiense TaxID=339268 RepID=UPI0009B64FC1|nr:SDR family NAD(P)-dependent oxidoreductase [Mycobacterium colombiense]
MSSTDPVAVVTGASRGIGAAVAIELANRGHRVLATMRNVAASDKLLSAAGSAVELIDVVALDVTAPGDFCFPETTAVLVNNAGGMEDDLPFEVTPMDQWRRTFELNVFAAVELTRRVVPIMRARRGGVICNFSTAATLQPTPWVSAYRAAKAAVSALDDSLRIELAPFGIRVVEIVPAIVDTDALYECAVIRPPEAVRFAEYAEMAKRTTAGFEQIRHLATPPAVAAAAIVDAIFDNEGPMRRGCDPVARAALKNWRKSSDEDLYQAAVSGAAE